MAGSNDPDLARLYHVNSSLLRCRMLDGVLDADTRPMRSRTYPGSERVDLPGRDFNMETALGDVLRRRTSTREFHLRPMALDLVGRLLHASYGMRGYRRIEGQQVEDRPCPSAGGLYPLELYVVAQAVAGLPDGIYHYDPGPHQLELRSAGSFHRKVAEMAVAQGMIAHANLVLAVTAIFRRTMWKYGQRGYRYVWLDAGHLGQNLHLCATALGLGVVAVGGFFDDELNDLLQLPAGEEEVIFLVCIGQQAQQERDR